MNIPTRLVWKLDVFDDAGVVIASIFRHANLPASIGIPHGIHSEIHGNADAIAEALQDVGKAARFFPTHPQLPKPPADPSHN